MKAATRAANFAALVFPGAGTIANRQVVDTHFHTRAGFQSPSVPEGARPHVGRHRQHHWNKDAHRHPLVPKETGIGGVPCGPRVPILATFASTRDGFAPGVASTSVVVHRREEGVARLSVLPESSPALTHESRTYESAD